MAPMRSSAKDRHSKVIPEAARECGNPESRDDVIEIPGSRFACPGMTAPEI